MAITRRQFAQLIAGAAVCSAAPALSFAQTQGRLFRVGVSIDTLAGANINDARAAYKVWTKEIGRSLGMVRTEMIPEIFIPSAQMIKMIHEGSVDCFAITALEYAKIADLLDPDAVFIEDYSADGLEYLLVVHSANPYKKVEDLRGSQITTHHHHDTTLLNIWLSLLLANSGLPPLDRFFESQVSRDNLNQVVLPVFFRRTQAAALTRRSFNMAVELNPQLGRDLRVLATSPKVIPMVFCFRRGSDAEGVREFKDAMLKLRTVPAGQQVLELYQIKGYTARQSSCMKGTLEMVHQYDRLRARLDAGRPKTHS